MQIHSIFNHGFTTPITSNNSRQQIHYNHTLERDTFQKSPSFKWCEPHQVRRTEVSKLYLETLNANRVVEEQRRKQGELLDIQNKSALEATKKILNFANRMKGEAEFVPLWTIKTTPELQKAMDDSPVLGDPVQDLIALKNISKFKMNNPKYSEEVNQQGAGSLQLHTSIILAEQAKRNLDKSNLSDVDKQEVKEMVQIVQDKIDEVFGEGTYDKLIEVANMGENPTLEQKKESNRILKEIDSKAKRFEFGEEFNERLNALVEKQHIKFHHEHEHVHHHHEHEHVHEEDQNINILYHMHGPNGEHIHEHEHEHEHEHVHQ